VNGTNAEWAQADFVRLPTDLPEAVAAQNIYVVSHSMGNRIIGRGITTLLSDRLAGDLIVFREHAENRFGLEAVDTSAGSYWTFRK